MTYEEIAKKKLPRKVLLKNSRREVVLIGVEKVEYEEINSITNEKIIKDRWIGHISDGWKKYPISIADLMEPSELRNYERRVLPNPKPRGRGGY